MPSVGTRFRVNECSGLVPSTAVPPAQVPNNNSNNNSNNDTRGAVGVRLRSYFARAFFSLNHLSKFKQLLVDLSYILNTYFQLS